MIKTQTKRKEKITAVETEKKQTETQQDRKKQNRAGKILKQKGRKHSAGISETEVQFRWGRGGCL